MVSVLTDNYTEFCLHIAFFCLFVVVVVLCFVLNSAICTFCEANDGTLEHMFWDCAKIPVFWSDFVDWLYTIFSHCR